MTGNASNQRRKPRGMRRDRDCGSCKLRKVKCDLNRPRCLPCVQAGLQCGNYPRRTIWLTPATTTTTLRSSITNEGEPTAPEVFQMMVQEGPSVHHYHNFIRRLADFCHEINLVGTQGRHNYLCISGNAVRLASHLDGLMKSRVTRLSKVHNNGSVVESTHAANHRAVVLELLNMALASADPFAIVGIAVLAVLEVCDRPFGDWQCHLYGGRSLLDYHCGSPSELNRLSRYAPILIEILSRLVWFDTLGAIVRGTQELAFDDWHRELLDGQFFKAIGCPADTFEVFVYVATGKADTEPMDSCLQAVNQLSKLGVGQSEWDRCSDAFRCASAIALLGRINDPVIKLSRQAALASAVHRSCIAIKSLPKSSPFYVHLGVPAYLAGINAEDVEQCNVIYDYWLSCKFAETPHYPGALARCKEEWARKGLQIEYGDYNRRISEEIRINAP